MTESALKRARTMQATEVLAPPTVDHAMVAYIIAADEPEITKQIEANKETKSLLSVMCLLGETNQKLMAARGIMGEKLKDPKFHDFRKGIEAGEKGTKDILDSQGRAIKQSSEVIDEVPGYLRNLSKEMKRALDRETGPLGWGRNRVEAKPDLKKQLKDCLDPIIETGSVEIPNDVDVTMRLHEQASESFKEAIACLVSELDINHDRDVIQKAQQDKEDAQKRASEAENVHAESQRKAARATASLKGFEEASRLSLSAADMYERRKQQAKAELVEIESRLRSYTWNMYGFRTYMWKNDVALAEKEKTEKINELATLERELAMCKDKQGGVTREELPKVKAEAEIAVKEEQTALAKLREAQECVKKVEIMIQKEYDNVANQAEKNGVKNMAHLNMIRTMAKSLSGDAQLVDNIRNSQKTNLIKSLQKNATWAIQKVEQAKYLAEQLETVESLLEEFPQVDKFSSDTQALVSFYRRVDRERFFKLGTKGLIQLQLTEGPNGQLTTGPARLATPLSATPAEARPISSAFIKSKNDLVHEIEVRTDWSGELQAATSAPRARQVPEKEIFLVESLFSAEECTALLSRAEEHGFGGTDYPKRYRGNLRLITYDQSFAEAVWHRLQPLVPDTVMLNGEEWHAVGLNESWRLAKYYPGDRFMCHCDACFHRSNDEMSMFTVNAYMNDVLDGGSTRFYFSDDRKADFAVEPRAGLCLIFRQPPSEQYYHDGEELGSGVKYLFRSDVMYRKRR